MSRKHYFIIALFLALALAASYALMPRQREVALMNMKDKHFADALVAYEGELTQGTLTIEVAHQLSELYLQTGEVGKAIEVMEKFVALHPGHMEARKRLGTFYQYAQRPEDYVRNLEEINKLTPSPENLQTLSHIYNFSGEYDKQIDVLNALVARQADKNSGAFKDLASLLAAKKSYSEAIRTLQALKSAHPQDFSFSEEELLVNLLLDEKRSDEALQEASAWKSSNPSLADLAHLTNLLHFKGNAGLAETLLEGVTPEQFASTPELMEERILILLDRDQEDQAYAELKRLHDQGALSEPLAQRLLFLAAARADADLTGALLKTLDINGLSEPQMVTMVEIAAQRSDRELLGKLTAAHAGNPDAAARPVLAAVLALANADDSADAKLAALGQTALNHQQTLQVARACVRVKRHGCTHDLLKKLPAPHDLTANEAAAAGNLYLEMRAWDEGASFLAEAGKTHQSRDLEEIGVKFAAGRGDASAVDQWLGAQAQDVSTRLLSDLYFAALNNNHLALAADIAERLHARSDTPATRSYLGHAYVKTGQFENALALYRLGGEISEEDENNYLVALARLAPHNAQYRKELGDYAAKRLRADLPRERKMTLVYALVSAKQVGAAMPYIEELALKEGGQWAVLYADTLDKQGHHAQARDFWVRVAAQPSTSRKERRNIAYGLLDHGFKNDAEAIFARLAQSAAPMSEDVTALLYLWGPRLTQDQLDWLGARMDAEDDPKRKNQWAMHAAGSADSDSMLAFVSARPQSMDYPAIARRYFEALAGKGELAAKYEEFAADAQRSGRAALLRIYAQVAREYGLKRPARAAYDLLFALNPKDAIALREAGILAYAQADYYASELYLSGYLEIYNNELVADADAYQAIFTYAELLRARKLPGQASHYYQAALELINSHDLNTADAHSKAAQGMIWLGQSEQGIDRFKAAIALYPKDDVLRADLASAYIELKRYDDARELLATPPMAVYDTEHVSVGLPLDLSPISQYAMLSDNGELLLRRAAPGNSVTLFTEPNIEQSPWISYVSESYDQVLVAAKPGFRFAADTKEGEVSIRAVSDRASPVVQEARQIVLRYELLSARIDLETGHLYDATSRLAGLMREYGDDAQYLGFAANAENYGGNWQYASSLLRDARAIAPENQDIIRLERDIRRLNAQNLKLDQEWIRRGRTDEHITTLSGFVEATPNLHVGIEVKNNRALAKNIRRSDGRIGSFNAHKQAGEVYALYHRENGNHVKASFFGNHDTPGFGLKYAFLNPFGQTELLAELHRPEWDFVEGVLDDATRDRLAFLHTIKPDTAWIISGGGGLNRYNVEHVRNVASTASLNAGLAYRLREAQPSIVMSYAIDAEYDLSHKKGLDSRGNISRLYPLASRELHFVSLAAGYEFSEYTYGDMLLGYGYDRLGGSGPSIEGRITHEFTQAIDAQLRAAYGIDNRRSSANVSRVGGYVRWRF